MAGGVRKAVAEVVDKLIGRTAFTTIRGDLGYGCRIGAGVSAAHFLVTDRVGRFVLGHLGI
jgi:hypothetical protein